MLEQKAKQIRVLVVEDDDYMRLALRRYLTRRGYETYLATDGLSAVKELLDHDVDAIISDYKMSVFWGGYWVRFLKKHYEDVEIIFTSGFLKPDFDIPFPVLEMPVTIERPPGGRLVCIVPVDPQSQIPLFCLCWRCTCCDYSTDSKSSVNRRTFWGISTTPKKCLLDTLLAGPKAGFLDPRSAISRCRFHEHRLARELHEVLRGCAL